METVRRLAAVTWAAVCAGAFLVAMLLATIESSRDEGTARDAVFRALGHELWLWLLVFGPLAVLGIGLGRRVTSWVARSRVLVDAVGPVVGLSLMIAVVTAVIGVLSQI